MTVNILFFFFSSRRRHTRSLCDWSSDVCSSDLDVPERVAHRAQQLALDVYQLLGLYGFARVDLMLEEESQCLYVLEANAIPGLTETSLLPQAAEAAGVGFDELVERILELAWARAQGELAV